MTANRAGGREGGPRKSFIGEEREGDGNAGEKRRRPRSKLKSGDECCQNQMLLFQHNTERGEGRERRKGKDLTFFLSLRRLGKKGV